MSSAELGRGPDVLSNDVPNGNNGEACRIFELVPVWMRTGKLLSL